MRAKVVEDDQSGGDTQEGKSDSSMSSYKAVGTGLNSGSSDEPIFVETLKQAQAAKSARQQLEATTKSPITPIEYLMIPE